MFPIYSLKGFNTNQVELAKKSMPFNQSPPPQTNCGETVGELWVNCGETVGKLWVHLQFPHSFPTVFD